MAIEGNDWWWVAGAAAAGGIVGGLALKAGSQDIYFTGYRRWYIRNVPKNQTFKKALFSVLLHRSMVTLWFDDKMNPTIRIYEWVEPRDTALMQEVEFIPLIEGGSPVEKELTGFIEADEAIQMAEAYMVDQEEMVPAGEWGFIGYPIKAPREIPSRATVAQA